ncbi:MAG: MBL fold metallo-hydrolase [Clostridia bacterium]|nr:MBL fold metallo-hydrolase [Clostridia bacterium]
MKIICLIENTLQDYSSDLLSEHGLSLYIETANHHIIADTGASGKTWVNATKLGVDLSTVDMVFLSHGHYDHTGGALILNSKLKEGTPIYVAKNYDESHFNCAHQPAKMIGVDRQLTRLPNIKVIEEEVTKIDAEVEFLKDAKMTAELPIDSSNLKTLKGSPLEMITDDFNHEMYLVLIEGDKKILISGCAHKGIVNIVNHFIKTYSKAPDVVVSGFHMRKDTPYSPEEMVAIQDTASTLMEITKDAGTVFYTTHCTGDEAFGILHDEMGDKIKYLRTGAQIEI